MTDFDKLYPKGRTGKECTKVNCVRHSEYLAWVCGSSVLNFCTNCKHAHVSQYKRNEDVK